MKKFMLLVAVLFLTGCAVSSYKPYNAYAFPDGIIVTSPLMKDTINTTERAYLLSHEVCHIVLGHTDSVIVASSPRRELETDACAFVILKENDHDVCLVVKFMDRILVKQPRNIAYKKRRDHWKKEFACYN